MAPKFGTSGLRGLVSELTPALVQAHVAAFLRACPSGTGLFVARDLRDSSPRIAADVIAAAQGAGVAVTDCGAVPTPALALAALRAGAAAIMVTGSHIPADRNGLKFYTPEGEITKAEEAAILQALDATQTRPAPQESCARHDPGPDFIARYRDAFGPQALAGRRIGVWSHSAVGRDLLIETLAALGADVSEIGRSAAFIPIDTEAVAPETREMLATAAAAGGLDAIASTDGDGDRPLLSDATGQIIPGDILGQMTARALGAEAVVTPISSNSGVAQLGLAALRLTRIGSPYVIAGMAELARTNQHLRVVGYEANGGFLLGFDAQGPTGPLPRLMTRDSHLPIIAPLVLAGAGGLAAQVAREPARFTAADRVTGIDPVQASALVTKLARDHAAQQSFLAAFDAEALAGVDLTDGARLMLRSGRIVHLRPSGNAPELRVYAEAESRAQALALCTRGMEQARALLGK